jgi:hypothetical protein
MTKETEATYFRQMKEADAAYYAIKKEADGIAAMAESYKSLGEAFGGPGGLLSYMMIKEGVYEKLALANAKAINGLAPKVRSVKLLVCKYTNFLRRLQSGTPGIKAAAVPWMRQPLFATSCRTFHLFSRRSKSRLASLPQTG